jgi:5-methyltetrahydropteroyltriglutamate--homocysteine methyltransferase
MQGSTHRILTTHVGSLIRTPAIMLGLKARMLNQPYDQERLAADIRRGIADVVRKQVEVGIDIPNDGELGRHGFSVYANQRLEGLEPRPLDPGENVWSDGGDRAVFPEFFEQYNGHFRYLWMLPEVSLAELPNLPGNYERFRVVGPIKYKGQPAVQRDIDNLTFALRNLEVADAFMTATPPTGRRNDADLLKFYPTYEAYMYAVADALHEEYRAIVDAGFILQLDLAATGTGAGGAASIHQRVEALNYALRDIPEDRVRYHHCWGSMNHPHTTDVPLKDIVQQILKIKAQAYSIEAANPRHEHEWMVWKDVKLPDGKVLIPGLISHQTNVVEHPELVAWRIKNFASVVGKENVIAGADCGFSQHWDAIRVHPTVQWAKLQALVQGAALASQDLWGKKASSDPATAAISG